MTRAAALTLTLLSLSLLFLPSLSYLSTPLSPSLISTTPLVQTRYGPVEGYVLYSTAHYLGLPFAAPPLPPNRFQPPLPLQPWGPSTLHAFLPGPLCPQSLSSSTTSPHFLALGHEDCLYLNVYAPSNATAQSHLPVLVWIYGGAFIFGDGYEFGFYSGTDLVEAHGYVVVTFNYRLAGLGFLALEGLRGEGNVTGNAGMWDQVAALRWVQDNIEAFGGDPARVTIAGESAGGVSVCALLASQAGRGLFHAAIIESGSCDGSAFFPSLAVSEAWSVQFAHSVGCNFTDGPELADCMQQVPAERFVDPLAAVTVNESSSSSSAHSLSSPLSRFDLWKLPNTIDTVRALYSHALPLASITSSLSASPPPILYPSLPWSPTLDGVYLAELPLSSIRRGDWAKVPVVVGTNRDEATLFIDDLYDIVPNQLHKPLIPSDLPLILSHVFFGNQTLVNSTLALYPITESTSATEVTEAILRDWVFACPSRRLAQAVAAAGEARVWLYEFDYVGDWVEDRKLGVYHSSELEFVFDNAWPPVVHAFSDKDQQMADAFGEYWGGMVWAGDVNAGGQEGGQGKPDVLWPAWDAKLRTNIRLQVPPQPQSGLYATECDYWDGIAQLQLANGLPDLTSGQLRGRETEARERAQHRPPTSAMS